MKILLLSVLSVIALSLSSPGVANDPRLAAVQAQDDARVAAVLGGDQARLGEIFADELRYAHASGAVDSKASLLAALAGGKIKYLGWEYAERSFSFPAPTIALMTGRAHVKVGKPEGSSSMELSFLAVWREEAGRWRFVAWQSCKLPEPPAK